MTIEVILFARARDLVGRERCELELPTAATVADLRILLAERFSELEPLADHLLFAIGTDYVNDSTRLEPRVSVACFPPVSGG